MLAPSLILCPSKSEASFPVPWAQTRVSEKQKGTEETMFDFVDAVVKGNCGSSSLPVGLELRNQLLCRENSRSPGGIHTTAAEPPVALQGFVPTDLLICSFLRDPDLEHPTKPLLCLQNYKKKSLDNMYAIKFWVVCHDTVDNWPAWTSKVCTYY